MKEINSNIEHTTTNSCNNNDNGDGHDLLITFMFKALSDTLCISKHLIFTTASERSPS